jgi:ribonuclease Z
MLKTNRISPNRSGAAMIGRAALLALTLICPAGLGAARADELRVHLIGTGGPELTPGRAGIATLIDVHGQKLLFDAGRGVLQNIYLSRIHPNDVTKIFLTHLHSDHIEGLPSLWMTPWFMFARKQPVEIWGPPGTARMVEGMRLMYEHDLEHRSNPAFRRDYLDIKVTEIREGVVYEAGGVKITAFPVEHADGNPAFGYRLDAGDRSVLLSGDTTYNDNIVKYGDHVDVMVHNVVAFSDAMLKAGAMQPVLDKLATPEQAAQVFIKTAPRLAVFSHIVKKELPGPAGDAVVLERTRRAGYSGPLQMGFDRMTIDVGREIAVHAPLPADDVPEFDKVDSKF